MAYAILVKVLHQLMKGSPNVLRFKDLVSMLLQEEQPRKNRSNICVVD